MIPLAHRRPRPRDARTDDVGLERCEVLLAQHLRAVRRAFGAYGLGIIDLPSLGPEPLVSAQIRVGAVLYWCYELELAGLLPFVEALGEALSTGALPLDDPTGARRLFRWWRRKSDRFTAPERKAVFNQVFDPGRFDGEMRLVVDALTEIGRTRRDLQLSGLQARLATASVSLGKTVSDRSVGIAAFAARDIVADIRTALGFLRDPALSRTLGGGSPWRVLSSWAPRLLGRSPPVHQHIQRARAGLQILAWIADNAGSLDAGARRVGRTHVLVQAAESWRVALP